MAGAKVSIIIAIYKVEDYIERCLHTLFGQTLDCIEYIFVDDASPDNSMAILEKVVEQYPHRKEQIKIIHHDQNKGLAAARTSGILAATGEYLIHCDPDDYVELNMYEEMYEKAIEDNSDLVFCDYEKQGPEESKIIKVPFKNTPHELLKQRGGIHYWAPSWNILVRSSVLKQNEIVSSQERCLAEDYGLLVKILYYAKTQSHINKPFYHYLIRPSSLTTERTDKEKFKLYKINIDDISGFLQDKKGFKKIRKYIRLLHKFSIQKNFIDNPLEWYYYYKDINRFVYLLNDENIKTRIIWSFLLFNKFFFKMGSSLYKKINGRSILE